MSEAMTRLYHLLRMTVPVPAGCVGPEGSPMSPEFRISVQRITDKAVHFIVHAHGHNSDTLDLVITNEGLGLLAAAQPCDPERRVLMDDNTWSEPDPEYRPPCDKLVEALRELARQLDKEGEWQSASRIRVELSAWEKR